MRYTHILFIIGILLFFSSCASKKDIWYVQDSENYDNSKVQFSNIKIQPNDILKIDVKTLVEEVAAPYNRFNGANGGGGMAIEFLKLQGYVVSSENTITFPELGKISTQDKTVFELQEEIQHELVSKSLLVNPTVVVRIINFKVTILGAVRSPGTYNFSESNITLLQALGYAGDLTINGRRDNIKLIREINGNRRVTTIDLTDGDFLTSDYNQVKPNDVIVINQNAPEVTRSGYIGNIGTALSVFSIILSTVVLLTR